MDWQIECSRDLVLAIFRLAVSDYLGIAYGHDEPAPMKYTVRNQCLEAELFLKSRWCAYLGELVGLPAGLVWREALLMNRHESIDRASTAESLAA